MRNFYYELISYLSEHISDFFCQIQAQRRARIHQLRLEKGAAKAAEELEKCNNPLILLIVGFGVW